MASLFSRLSAMILVLAFAGVTACSAGDRANSALPTPAVDAPMVSANGEQTAVIAGRCFWGIQAVFQHTKSVISAASGYSGGSAKPAEYELVSTGETGHAESVKVTYHPSKITYGQLLRVFFSMAHDPTQLNRQGPDEGTQYRSSIFYGSEEQKRITEAYITQLEKAKVFQRPIVTQVVPLEAFYPAERLSPRLCCTPSEQPIHRVQRCTEGCSSSRAVSGPLHGQVGPSGESGYVRL